MIARLPKNERNQNPFRCNKRGRWIHWQDKGDYHSEQGFKMKKPLFMFQTQSSVSTPMQDVLQLWRKKFTTPLNLTDERSGEGVLVIAGSLAELRGGARFAAKSEHYSTRPFIWLNPEEKSITYYSSPDIALFQATSGMRAIHKQTGELPAMI